MKDKDKNRDQLLDEIHELRNRLDRSGKGGAGRRDEGTRPPEESNSQAPGREGLPVDGDAELGDISLALEKLSREILERRRAEMRLRESEEKYRTLFENANDAVFVIQEGAIVFLNPRTEKITGSSREELSRIPFLQFVHPDDRDFVLRMQEEQLKKERVRSPFSFRMVDSRGKERMVQLNAVPIPWEGRPATLNFLRDITEIRRLEDQFRQAQKMESIGTLAGGIAHDFNNILMGIQGRASLGLMDLEESHPCHAHLKGIGDDVRRATDLTRQLLGFAREGKYKVKPADLNDMILTTTEMFGRTRKEIRIHRRYQEGIWPVDVDRGQIEQVLLNLYVNAWQAMTGGGDLYVETENAVLDDTYLAPHRAPGGRYVKVLIADTGIGMDEATQRKVFDPFFTTKPIGRSTGLGLASAYGIVRNHGGIIEVASEKGKGSVFTVFLPASGKEVPEEEATSREIEAGHETVLLVDDEDMVVDVGTALLRRLGYEVLAAKSGEEALRLYAENRDRVQLVLLDMIMPEMGGGEIFDRMKEINPGVKVLLSSGYSLEGKAAEIMKRGCRGFIQKPFGISELSQKIREIVSG
ncbi:MAG: PAS domain S-box protein [Deltaproteobacteria bacterium]|nr:PAS domain S-box protein [Deltaproteobacteria bacterium]